MNITKDDCELINVQRIWAKGVSAQIATRRVENEPDQLYAWKGRYDNPTKDWIQAYLETNREFRARVRREIGL